MPLSVLIRKVPEARDQNQFGALADMAADCVAITGNGRTACTAVKRRDRRVVWLEDFTDEEMALGATAEVSTTRVRPPR
jgi:hypothetical protein